ncbi:MAG: 2'-5' RNA ligase family protein [Micrococcales bacterium]|nr:2'-5' RNA ligase family protein [Micrococcales bacterium]
MVQSSVPGVPTEAALLVMCPVADPIVGQYRRLYDSAAHVGIPAHITVDYPFKPDPDADDLASLAALFARIGAFTTTFETSGWVGGDVLFLRPAAEEPFACCTGPSPTPFPIGQSTVVSTICTYRI